MNKYRIIEKKGEYKNVMYPPSSDGCVGHYCCSCGETVNEYIPRFIVQESENTAELLGGQMVGSHIMPVTCVFNSVFKDLKEFNNLEEAKAYKRDLDLEAGIIIE